MMFLAWCWYPVRQFAGVVFPWREDAKETAPLLLFRWCLHALFWSSLLVGLWQVNRLGAIETLLRSPWPVLHRSWLPLVALLVYVLSWLSRGLWLALRSDAVVGEWPDLEATWHDARTALKAAKIDLAEVPVFLVLGPLSRDLQLILESLGACLMTPRANVPFQVFAHRDALFIVCAQLAQRGMPRDAFKSEIDGNETAAARLHFVCQLLARARTGMPAIQGIVLVTPFGAMQSEADAQGVVCRTQDDLRVVRQATGLEVPLFVAVSGLDLQAAGSTSHSAWLQRFPPLPDLDPAEVRVMLRQGIDWLCWERVLQETRACFRLDVVANSEVKSSSALQENIRLFRRLGAVHAWRANMACLLVEGTRNDFSEPGMVAGCYVLPVGDTKAPELAKALWEDLLGHQHTTVATVEGIATEAERSWRTRFGYSLGLLGVSACLAFAGWCVMYRY